MITPSATSAPHLAAHPAVIGGPSPALLDALFDALASERRLLDDLIAQMRQQRTAVGSEDIDGVDESVFATHRILATLGQARQRRRRLNELLGGTADLPLRELEALLGDRMEPRLRDARLQLQGAAETLAREVGMNRKLLREALSQNEQFVRALVGPATDATYEQQPAARPTPARGVILNRTA